ncbi:unnamed protein product [Urochloa humidicola]
MTCQLVTEKSGWILVPTNVGGLFTLSVVLSSGDSEFWADKASDFWSSGDVMAESHLQPGRSTILRYVDAVDILLVVAIQNCNVLSSGRGSVSCRRMLRSPATRTAGKFLQGSSCNLFICQGCLCKNVNFMDHM